MEVITQITLTTLRGQTYTFRYFRPVTFVDICDVVLGTYALHRKGIPQNFRPCKIRSNIRYKMNEIRRHPLHRTFRNRAFRQFCEIKELSNSKLGYKSCSTFPLILGIYYIH